MQYIIVAIIIMYAIFRKTYILLSLLAIYHIHLFTISSLWHQRQTMNSYTATTPPPTNIITTTSPVFNYHPQYPVLQSQTHLCRYVSNTLTSRFITRYAIVLIMLIGITRESRNAYDQLLSCRDLHGSVSEVANCISCTEAKPPFSSFSYFR